jgi:hypothetical protein
VLLRKGFREASGSSIADLRTFAEGLQRKYSALKGSLIYPYSTGPVEGQINRLKLIKRSMNGRGSFELLRIHVLIVAQMEHGTSGRSTKSGQVSFCELSDRGKGTTSAESD